MQEQHRRLQECHARGETHFYMMEIDANQIIDARSKVVTVTRVSSVTSQFVNVFFICRVTWLALLIIRVSPMRSFK
jgi:hypothetical protein